MPCTMFRQTEIFEGCTIETFIVTVIRFLGYNKQLETSLVVDFLIHNLYVPGMAPH